MPSPWDSPGPFQVVLVVGVLFLAGGLVNDVRHRLVARWRRRHRA